MRKGIIPRKQSLHLVISTESCIFILYLGHKDMKVQMTFIQIIESEFYYLVEAIEHGSSDNEVIENYKNELFEKQDINTLISINF